MFFLQTFLAPVLVFAAFLIYFKFAKLSQKKVEAKGKFKKIIYKSPKNEIICSVCLFCLLCAVFFAANIIMKNFMQVENYSKNFVSPVVQSIICVLCFSSFAAGFYDNLNLKKFLKQAAVLSLVVCLCEVFVFNAKSITDKPFSVVYNASDLGGFELITNDKGIDLSNDAVVEITDVPENTGAAVLNLSEEKNDTGHKIKVTSSYKDENFPLTYQVVGDKYTSSSAHNLYFKFLPYGKISSIQFSISEVAPLKASLHSVTLMAKIPMNFSLTRFLILFLFIALIFLIVDFGLWKVTYDRKKTLHNVLIFAVCALCVTSASMFSYNELNPADYTQKKYSTYLKFDSPTDAYAHIYDAFRKGQTNIDVDVDPALETLGDDVYKNDVLAQSNMIHRWDTVYYKGKYYEYFGIGPVISFYYPYVAIHGKIPPLQVTAQVFSTFAILFICLAVLAAIRLLCQKPNLLLTLLIIPATVAMSGIYYALQFKDTYFVAVAAGTCFINLCLWLAFSGLCEKKKFLQCIRFAFSGAALGLCAMSRPSIALNAVILLPFLFSALKRKTNKLWYKILMAALFALPIIACIIILGYYNFARFGSPFDFGEKYQLTVSDQRANTLTLSLLPAMIQGFFLNIPRLRSTFPFFEPNFFAFNNYNRYTYVADAVGILTYPAAILAVFRVPMAWQRGKTVSRINEKRFYSSKLLINLFICLAFVSAIIIGWNDFCRAGLSQRYICDIMPLIGLLTAIILVRSVQEAKNHARLYAITVFALLATLIYVFLFNVGWNDVSMARHDPQLCDKVRNLMLFWQ